MLGFYPGSAAHQATRSLHLVCMAALVSIDSRALGAAPAYLSAMLIDYAVSRAPRSGLLAYH